MKNTLIFFALLVMCAELNAGSPLELLARDPGSGELLYRQSITVLGTGERLSQVDSLYLDGAGQQLGRMQLDFSESSIQPQVDYHGRRQELLQLERTERRWQLRRRAGGAARIQDSWPKPRQQDVLAQALPRVISEQRERILAGELQSINVWFLPASRAQSLDIRHELRAGPQGEVLHVTLLQPRVFSEDEELISLELLMQSGRLLRYFGPDLCPCGAGRRVRFDYYY